jgi:hypothetical protein
VITDEPIIGADLDRQPKRAKYSDAPKASATVVKDFKRASHFGLLDHSAEVPQHQDQTAKQRKRMGKSACPVPATST